MHGTLSHFDATRESYGICGSAGTPFTRFPLRRDRDRTCQHGS